MRKSYTKYPFRVFSFAVRIGYTLSTFSLCSLMIINCDTEEVSCSTKACEETTQTCSDTENECCCKITEAPKQPAEIITPSYDISKKHISYAIHYYNIESFDNANHKLAIIKNFSFHSPPGKRYLYLKFHLQNLELKKTV